MWSGSYTCPPPFASNIPDFLCRWPFDAPRRRRRRRRGKRAGVTIRIKFGFLFGSTRPSDFPSPAPWPISGRYVVRRSLEKPYRWIRPIVPGFLDVPARPISPQIHGVNHGVLRLLNLGYPLPCKSPPIRMGLINVRSLVNKTFILHDLFTSKDLDFIFLTETWVKEGDSSPFSELIPHDYTFYNCPRKTGRGGGLAAVFKLKFTTRTIPIGVCSRFEVQLLQIDLVHPVLCVNIYRPPRINNDFLIEFSNLLGELIPRFDYILVLGDFNIHLCCPTKPLVTEFKNLIDSFDFVQWVQEPTHTHGHRLDLVLSHGFRLSDIEISETCFSDHKLVLFSSHFPDPIVATPSVTRLNRYFSTQSCERFAASYAITDSPVSELSSPVQDVN